MDANDLLNAQRAIEAAHERLAEARDGYEAARARDLMQKAEVDYWFALYCLADGREPYCHKPFTTKEN